MTYLLQGSLAVIVSAIVCLVLDRQGKEYSVLVCLCVCAGILTLCLVYLEPVLSFVRQIESMGGLDGSLVKILFKVLGISVVSDISAMICSDAGRASLGKVLHMFATAVILWLSIPVFQALLELIHQILGEI